MVLLNNKEPVSTGQAQRPLNHGASPPADTSAKVPASKANDTPEGPAEAKKSKRERKEERQKKRRKEKKELKLENHQGGSKSQRPKKRLDGGEPGGEADPAAAGSSSAAKRQRRGKSELVEDGGAQGAGAPADEEPVAPGAPSRRKRKLSEGVWLP